MCDYSEVQAKGYFKQPETNQTDWILSTPKENMLTACTTSCTSRKPFSTPEAKN
jgi:hypothetical protein